MSRLFAALAAAFFILVAPAAATRTPPGQDKVTICHQPGTPAQQVMEVPPTAVPGHLGHGDTLGACPAQTPVPTPEPTPVPPVVTPEAAPPASVPPGSTPAPEATPTPEQGAIGKPSRERGGKKRRPNTKASEGQVPERDVVRFDDSSAKTLPYTGPDWRVVVGGVLLLGAGLLAWKAWRESE